MNSKTEKYISYGMLGLLILTLLPVIYLGRYNHPTGDDYYYTAGTRLVWEETGSALAVLKEAANGVAREYQIWQGTYSAMFLMHLAPNLFGDGAYRFVTGIIILTLVGSIFYFLKPLVVGWLKGTKECWVIIASALSLLCVQTVPSQGESFFWYNGSMYYTGYFAVMLFMLGLAMRWLEKGGAVRLAVLIFLAAFSAGGNYVSLLPGMLLFGSMTALLAYRKERKAWGIALLVLVMLGGLIISAMAPGNAVRQMGMWKIPAWKAVAKSLLQGIRYIWAWTGGWWIFVALAITPFLWKCLKRTTFNFSFPLVVIGYLYGIFCSMSCPTFYTMNSTGPARAVAIVYYGYVLISFVAYGYFLGYVQKKWLSEWRGKSGKGVWGVYITGIVAVLVLQCIMGAMESTTSVKAIRLLASGEARAYEREYQQRLEILEDESVTDVVFRPYEHQPDMLYVGDIPADEKDPTSVKIAQYFHKNSVRVEY